jgi:outer membrane receptor protein involved in Fe transport
LVFAAAVQAQTSRGTVSGAVTDPAGAVVVGAHVTITHGATGAHRTGLTNDAGLYRFDAVDPGTYELKLTHPGFSSFVATGVGVEANRNSVTDVRLKLGSESTAIQVSADAQALAVLDGPLRGGNFLPREVSQLPLTNSSPLSLADTLPGVIRPSGGEVTEGGGAAVQFSVNGQRVRGNNFLLDGTENNDIGFTGIAQPFNIADAVEEVSVQTTNFSVEFGRAAGAVLNVVTKSGSNGFHGTASWRYQSQRFDSVSNLDRVNGEPKAVFVHNVAGFTAGGPVRKDKTFFFAAFQQDTNRSTGTFPLVVPTSATVDTLRGLFPGNPRLELYLNALGNLRGTAAPFPQALGIDLKTGADHGFVQFATAPLALPQRNQGPEWLIRFDHYWSEAHRISGRYIYDSRISTPNGVPFPGFMTDSGERNQNLLFTDTYTFTSRFTNEFRFSFGRLHADQQQISPDSIAEAHTLPKIVIQNAAAPGLNGSQQFRYADNYLLQETQTRLMGRHTLRYGVEFLRELATQRPNAYPSGEVDFNNSPGYSAFANFLDDYSGQPGRIRLTIGGDRFYPNQFRQSYFVQDAWKTAPSLTITLGLRYENFGQPLNALRYPAFTGFDPNLFFQPNRVDADNKDFGPAAGLAWSPSPRSRLFSRLFGERKTVWRAGYQISYVPLYTQALSLDLAASTPNAITIDQRAINTSGRGDANWFEQLPSATKRPPSLLDTQYGTFEKNFRYPYTERWSLGFQRHLLGQTLLDVSYVGAEGHRLTTRVDENPQQPGGLRLHPDFGPRTIRAGLANSSYHSLQAQADRRLARGNRVSASYTWSKSLDSTSEGINEIETQYQNSNLTSVPVSQGGLKLDHGVSDFDRRQRLTLLYLWDIPGPRTGWRRQFFSGWMLAGITTFQSGTPFTMINGFDRNGDGWPGDRPDISSPDAPVTSRAVIWPTTGPQGCATGYRSPDTNLCVNPSDVHWVEGAGFPNATTVGRNTMHTGGTNNFDADLFKTLTLGEHRRLELRWEALNVFNHPQFVNMPPTGFTLFRDVVNSAPGRFLNRDLTDSGIRSMWGQIKLVF